MLLNNQWTKGKRMEMFKVKKKRQRGKNKHLWNVSKVILFKEMYRLDRLF